MQAPLSCREVCSLPPRLPPISSKPSFCLHIPMHHPNLGKHRGDPSSKARLYHGKTCDKASASPKGLEVVPKGG